MDDESGKEEPLEIYADVDYDDFESGNSCLKILNSPTLLKVVGERIANEILMYFRSQRKSAGDVSLSDFIETGKDGGSLSVMDVLCTDEDMLEQAHVRSEIRRLAVMMDRVLTQRERQILILRYGLEHMKPLPQREVAQLLGISRSYVSRIEKKALDKLKAALEDSKTI